jgi:hypothetical protein
LYINIQKGKTIFQKYIVLDIANEITYLNVPNGRRGRDGMVLGFQTTYAIGAYHH